MASNPEARLNEIRKRLKLYAEFGCEGSEFEDEACFSFWPNEPRQWCPRCLMQETDKAVAVLSTEVERLTASFEAITEEWKRVAAERDTLKAEIADAREACPSVRQQANFDLQLLKLIDKEVSRGFMLDSQVARLVVERDALRAILDAVDVACFGVEAPRLAYAALPAHITHVKRMGESERDTLKAERDKLAAAIKWCLNSDARELYARAFGAEAMREETALRAVVRDVVQQMRNIAVMTWTSHGLADYAKKWADTLAAALEPKP